MNKKLLLLLPLSCLANDYAYMDGQYKEAEILYQEAWQKNGNIKDFEGYIKSLIKQEDYSLALNKIKACRIKSSYLSYLENYCYLALQDFEKSQLVENEDLINYINVKEAKPSIVDKDISKVLNDVKVEDINDPFMKLYKLCQNQDVLGVKDFIFENKKTLKTAKTKYQWLALLEAYKILRQFNIPMKNDIKDFLSYSATDLDIRKQVNEEFFSQDKYGRYAAKDFTSFRNIESFDLLINFSTKGQMTKQELLKLIKLNRANQEDFMYIKASIDRDFKQFYDLYELYGKEKYLYYYFICLLEDDKSFEKIKDKQNILFSNKNILMAFIEYLQNTKLKDYKYIQFLEPYIKDSEIAILYARLIYDFVPDKSREIWQRELNEESYNYLLIDSFNEKNTLFEQEDYKNKNNYHVLQGVLNFRKGLYNYKRIDLGEETYLNDQNQFLSAIKESRSAQFAKAAKDLDYNSQNAFINGKLADFLFLEGNLENDEETIERALNIYQNLADNDIYRESLRYKIFTCLLIFKNDSQISQFIEENVFNKELNLNNTYDRRLIYDAYRYCENKGLKSFITSISNKYGLRL